MELILISAGKLKIMLTDSDMKKYDLKAEAVDYNNTETRRAFWNILDDAKHETGFDAASDRLFIQMYPSKDGGCEMFVTKLETLPHETKSGDKRKGRPALEETGREYLAVYSFDKLDPLICVCRRLLQNNWLGKSRAYREPDGKCYLFLSECVSEGRRAMRHATISEYGISEHAETALLYIKEYADTLCEAHAVETLGIL